MNVNFFSQQLLIISAEIDVDGTSGEAEEECGQSFFFCSGGETGVYWLPSEIARHNI